VTFPGSDPPFALAEGGGIDSSGVLTLIDSRVTNNESGSAASEPPIVSHAIAGGIYSHIQGVLSIRRSVVSGNRAHAIPPNGQFAGGGGITSFGLMSLTDSLVSDNSAELSSLFPSEQVALAGGIHLAECCGPPPPTTITNTVIRGNRAEASNVSGDAIAFAGGVLDEGDLLLTGGAVEGNEVIASVPSSSSAGAFGDGGGLEVDGIAAIHKSRIAGNTVTMTAPNGFALSQGGGLANAGQTTLEKVIVVGNSATANGSDGIVQGGGVWNGTFEGPPPELTLTDSVIVANKLTASPGIPVQGGGLYTDFPVTLTKTVIAGNKPDQCFGC
jgi:hypothetical protein